MAEQKLPDKAQENEMKREKVRVVPIKYIDDSPDHPFQVRDDEEMMSLVESIATFGVITPIIARKTADERYELISGHRRKRACELLHIDTLPIIVRDLSREEGIILIFCHPSIEPHSNTGDKMCAAALYKTFDYLKLSFSEFKICFIFARIKEDQRYEIISGHRRVHACRRLGLKLIPAIVRDLSRDEAIIAMVDANLQREHILPSEKAAAYKMKMDAMKRRAGRPSKENVSPLGTNLRTDEIIAQEAGESRNQVQRYIRLNELVPELLEMVDRESIAFRPAVELSYLSEDEQRNLVETIDSEEATPSLSQAIRMKKLSQEGKLDMDKIFSIMTEEKPNQAETVKFKSDELSRFFPERTPPELIRQTILKLLDAWQKSKATERTIIRRSRDDAR